jgi:hypothetical protein
VATHFWNSNEFSAVRLALVRARLTNRVKPAPRDVLRGRSQGRIAFANTDLAGASDHRNSIREADRALKQLIVG